MATVTPRFPYGRLLRTWNGVDYVIEGPTDVPDDLAQRLADQGKVDIAAMSPKPAAVKKAAARKKPAAPTPEAG